MTTSHSSWMKDLLRLRSRFAAVNRKYIAIADTGKII